MLLQVVVNMEDIRRADDDRRFGVAGTAAVITTSDPTRTIETAVIDICLEELVRDTMSLTEKAFKKTCDNFDLLI